MNIIQSTKVSVAAVYDVKTNWLKDDIIQDIHLMRLIELYNSANYKK